MHLELLLKKKKSSMQRTMIPIAAYWMSTSVFLQSFPTYSGRILKHLLLLYQFPNYWERQPRKKEGSLTLQDVESQSCAVCHTNALAWLTWSPLLAEGFLLLWGSSEVKEPNNRSATPLLTYLERENWMLVLQLLLQNNLFEPRCWVRQDSR